MIYDGLTPTERQVADCRETQVEEEKRSAQQCSAILIFTERNVYRVASNNNL
jgi:hypothetical protein